MLSITDSAIRSNPPQEMLSGSDLDGKLARVLTTAHAPWRPANQNRSDPHHGGASVRGLNEHRQHRFNTPEFALTVAHEEIERLYAMLRPLGYWVVMADPTGVIVHRRCHPAEQHSLDSVGVVAGMRWPEASNNALGPGHVHPEPVCTQRENHSSNKHRTLNSVAIRISDPRVESLGSLGAFAPATTATDAAFSLVVSLLSDWVNAIEERLFRDAYSDAWVLCIALNEGERSPGLLAVDSGQCLLAANGVSRGALGFTDQVMGKKLETLQVGGVPKPRKSPNQRDDVHFQMRLQAKQCTAAALLSAPIEAWSTPEFRQFRTRPRVLVPGRPHPSSRQCMRSGGLSPNVLSAIQSYIVCHLAETIPVSTLADKAGLSRNYFLSAFSKSTGVTPHRFIVQQRNAKAAEMLKNTDMELADIALTVGFADQSHFTRSFSRLMDCTPSAFRRRAR